MKKEKLRDEIYLEFARAKSMLENNMIGRRFWTLFGRKGYTKNEDMLLWVECLERVLLKLID